MRKLLSSSHCYSFVSTAVIITTLLVSVLSFTSAMASSTVVVDTVKKGNGPAVTKDHKYHSMVTLYNEDGADRDQPFDFQPYSGLIQGWSDGVVQMVEGERALLHVPSQLGYGSSPMGSPGGAFYIPANSDLLFDIEILGKVGASSAADL